jgi:hypothetical protein
MSQVFTLRVTTKEGSFIVEKTIQQKSMLRVMRGLLRKHNATEVEVIESVPTK